MYKKLISIFILAISISCGSTDILQSSRHMEKGSSYYSSGELRKAIEEYSQVINFNPDDYRAYRMRGAVYKKLGEYQNAIDDFSQIIRIRPFYEMAYYNRGNIYMILGLYEEAIRDLEMAVKLNSNPLFSDALASAYKEVEKSENQRENGE